MPEKLGQNFLIDTGVVEKIISSAGLKNSDVVFEIGPGRGILTEELAKNCKKVIAVELDESLVVLLRNKFKGNNKIEIVQADILKINLKKLFTDYQLPITNYKLISNLPYYITSPIIRLFLESDLPPSEMILMLQKEVAERIVARQGQMSLLAVSVQYYASAKMLFNVDKSSFSPVPKVNSAVIHITRNSKLETRSREETKGFFRIVRAGFSARRKTLANNLSNGLHIKKELAEDKIKKTGLLPTVRAQELSIRNWKALVIEISSLI